MKQHAKVFNMKHVGKALFNMPNVFNMCVFLDWGSQSVRFCPAARMSSDHGQGNPRPSVTASSDAEGAGPRGPRGPWPWS